MCLQEKSWRHRKIRAANLSLSQKTVAGNLADCLLLVLWWFQLLLLPTLAAWRGDRKFLQHKRQRLNKNHHVLLGGIKIHVGRGYGRCEYVNF
jgi:hypothetical protein